MAQISIKDSLFQDSRFIDLAIRTGSMRNALGALVEVWLKAQKFWYPDRLPIPREEWVKHRLAQETVDCGLVQETPEGFLVRGANEHFQWMFSHYDKARKGGLASAEARKRKNGTAQPMPNPPRTTPEPGVRETPNPPEASISISSRVSSSSRTRTEEENSTAPLRSAVLPQQREKSRSSGAVPEFAGDPLLSAMLETVSFSAQRAWLASYQDREFLALEMRKAHAWIASNPRRAPKQVAKFLANWFSRAYEAHRKKQPVASTASTRNAEVLNHLASRVMDGDL